MAPRYWLIALAVACSGSNPSPAPRPPPPPVVPAPNPEPVAINAAVADPPAGSAADGATCLASSDCASGTCEGEGCDGAHPGHCAKVNRICTRNRVPMCGCDGKTFYASSTCPRNRYASRGACASP
jgi:hypothetical protein